MKSLVNKRSILIAGRRTSVAVEDAFWNGLKEIAKQRHETLSHVVASIDASRAHANLSSAIRLFVLGFYRDQWEGRNGALVSPTLDGFRPSSALREAPSALPDR